MSCGNVFYTRNKNNYANMILPFTGGESLPSSISGRTMISFFWLFSILFVGTYCGNLIAFLTVSIEKPPFQSMAEMVQQDDIKWGTLGGTYFITWFSVSLFLFFIYYLRYLCCACFTLTALGRSGSF